jgi:hypothetical protein
MMNITNTPQRTATNWPGSLVVGLYAWLATISFGLVLLDVVYAGLVPEATTALSEAADFLLLVNAVTILAALGAIGLSWRSPMARNLLIASLAVIFLGFFAYALLASSLPAGSALGTWLRIGLAGSVSVLAFMGLYKFRNDEWRVAN